MFCFEYPIYLKFLSLHLSLYWLSVSTVDIIVKDLVVYLFTNVVICDCSVWWWTRRTWTRWARCAAAAAARAASVALRVRAPRLQSGRQARCLTTWWRAAPPSPRPRPPRRRLPPLHPPKPPWHPSPLSPRDDPPHHWRPFPLIYHLDGLLRYVLLIICSKILLSTSYFMIARFLGVDYTSNVMCVSTYSQRTLHLDVKLYFNVIK